MTNTIQRIVDLAIEVQQIPAPTFQEAQRAEFIRGLLESEGLKEVSMDEVGNVYGRLSNVTRQTLNVSSLERSPSVNGEADAVGAKRIASHCD